MKKFIIVAVSNYGKEFDWTKHNIGKNFLLSFIPEKDFFERKSYFVHDSTFENSNLSFIFTKTYMNITGKILKEYELCNMYQQKNSPITIIIHDDLEISFGKNKFRDHKDRGERGHNGLRSLTKELQITLGDKYKKPFYFSLGIERPKDQTPVHSWVLTKFNNQEIEYLEKNCFKVAEEELYKNIKKLIHN